MYNNLISTIESLSIQSIDDDRKQRLDQLSSYIQYKKDNKESIALNFICTHNSRRSHLGQVWAKAMASYYNISHVDTYSGGTEATAMYNQIKLTLANQGFSIVAISEGSNAVQAIRYDDQDLPIVAFSKKYDHKFNPTHKFAAVMTCTDADENCPLVLGSDKRISLPYVDPKSSDGSANMKETYHATSQKVATEMKYVFSKITQ